MAREVLKLENITKIYDNGIVANKNINLSINNNEIHAIVGENGAGKSTLMKIIFGMEQANSGSYYLNGEKLIIDSVEKAIDLGIGMVHQHFMLVESMDVVDNVMLGIEPKRGLFIDKEAAKKKVMEIADKYNFKLDFDRPVSELSIGMKQKVEITKALVRGAKILIFDEPTAVLTPQETDELFEQLKKLTSSDHTIIFISHKLNEVKEISNRITIIRKGETKGTYNTNDVSLQEIANLMIGKELDSSVILEKIKTSEKVLEVKKLDLMAGNKKLLKDINFNIHGGEIVSIAGVEGNGQVDLINVLIGQEKAYSGDVKLLNKDLKGYTVKSMRDNGFGYIPEDRMSIGIAQEETILNNLISTRYTERDFNKGIILNKEFIERYSDDIIREFDIVCRDNKHIIGYLSGGNIQKVVVGRECYKQPRMLICEQPTRGVDLGAAAIIHEKLIELRKKGTGILLISADLSEVVKISDRCLVMYDGEIVANIKNPREIDTSELGEYMLGLKRQEEVSI